MTRPYRLKTSDTYIGSQHWQMLPLAWLSCEAVNILSLIRVMVLKMIAEGRITLEEGDMLLEALGS